ncbi:MAG: HPr family phosphocarrier protein [Lachnospiraceae bacterium]|nr:HPr family phosphocarrier protein [Lachnospiraceae bacterium]
MCKAQLLVSNPSGLHLRPAGLFCEKAMEFQSRVTFRYRGDNIGNAKSVLSILGACIRSGDTIELICEGEDEDEAYAAITDLIEGGFGEEI